MRLGLAAALLLVGTASAHRVDEYLQATTISVGQERVEGQIRLTPGTAVFSFVMSGIDMDSDGRVSSDEQKAYAERVLRDVSLSVDGERLRVGLVSVSFPEAAAMKEGLGAIQVDFAADVPREGGARTLVFENRHQKGIAAYLVNGLEARDPAVRVTAQRRNYDQSHYELDYILPGSRRWPGGGLAVFAALAAGCLAVRLIAARRKRAA